VGWLHWQEATLLYARDMVRWEYGAPVYDVRGGCSRRDHSITRIRLHSIIACEGQWLGQRQTPPLTNSALFIRDRHLCLYCGRKFSAKQLTRDHVMPRSKGGPDHWKNVVSACRRCNQFKADKLPEEAGMELIALPYKPNFAEYLAMVNTHRILGDQMEFLSLQFPEQTVWHKELAFN